MEIHPTQDTTVDSVSTSHKRKKPRACGVDAEAKVDRVTSALREHEEDRHEQGRKNPQLHDQEDVFRRAAAAVRGAVRVPRS